MRISKLAVTLSTFSPLLFAACGGASEQTPAAAPTTSTTASASAAPTASATAAPTSTAAADAPPAKPERPQLKFWGYDGPAEGPAITGKRAWTAVPTGAADDRYRHVFISVEDFVKADGGNNFFRAPFGDIVAPIAMGANLTPPAALKKGDAVFADSSNDSAVGRVVSVDGETVKMKYVFGDLVGDIEAPRSETVIIDGALRFGAPVAFKQDAKWYVGRLIAKTATDAWIALHYTDNQPFAKVKVADVRGLDPKVLKVGDKCVADSSYASRNELMPGKVTKVIEDGVFYEVKTDKGATWTVPFHHVSAPL